MAPPMTVERIAFRLRRLLDGTHVPALPQPAQWQRSQLVALMTRRGRLDSPTQRSDACRIDVPWPQGHPAGSWRTRVRAPQPSVARRPASVILTRTTSIVLPPALTLWRCAVASPARTRLASIARVIP